LLLREGGRYRLAQIPEGSIVYSRDPKPDSNGMVEGTYKGASVLMFSIDLEERTELLPMRSAVSADVAVHRRSA
jgi:hypothetical protein